MITHSVINIVIFVTFEPIRDEEVWGGQYLLGLESIPEVGDTMVASDLLLRVSLQKNTIEWKILDHPNLPNV